MTFDMTSCGTLIEVFEQCGIDLGRVYVAGGTALHAYLCKIGKTPEWTPGDVDLFIEPGSLPLGEEVEKVRDVLARSFECTMMSKARILANTPGVNVDFIFSRHDGRTISEWVGSFDISVCKVYFPLSTWKNPDYMFADTAQSDIDDGIMRVALALPGVDESGSSGLYASLSFAEKKLERVIKYRKRGFRAIVDPAYLDAVHIDQYND